MARFPTIDLIGCGQSQCLMFATAGGETNDTGLSETGSGRLVSRLQALLPGTTVNWAGANNQTWRASIALFSEFQGDSPAEAFYTASPFANANHGAAQRSYITGRKGANKAGLVVHYMQTQDCSSASFNAATYATGAQGLVDAMLADNATGWGDFAILPVLGSTRQGTAPNEGVRIAAYRRIWSTLAGQDNYPGVTRRPGVLPPVGCVNSLVVAAYSGGGDWTHFVRSTSLRAADAIAISAANWMGAAPVMASQPRLCRAVLVAPGVVRAFFTVGAAGARLLQIASGTRGFELSSGTVTGSSEPDNSAAALTGFVTIDLSVTGMGAGARLRFRTALAGLWFANGTTPPRGEAGNFTAAISPGASINAVTDGAEDVKLADGDWALSAINNDAGVPVEVL